MTVPPARSRVRRAIGRTLRRGLDRFGYEIARTRAGHPIPPDCDERAAEVFDAVRPYTLTPPERVMALRDAIRYLERAGIPGAIVECGVWRGGSMMAAALTLLELGSVDREIYMFDTFSEFPPPDDRDVDTHGVPLADRWDPSIQDHPMFSYLPLARVRELLQETGYPAERLHLVPGLIEETIPQQAPQQIALCRLDTDLYRATVHEMKHLYPRISAGGVLIVDDYGEYPGVRRAVDEYLEADDQPVLLTRIDLSCRMAVLPTGTDSR